MHKLRALLHVKQHSKANESRPDEERRLTGSILLAVAVVLTILWQQTFQYAGPKLDLTYRVTTAAGVFGQQTFYYFYYYLDLFPVYAEGVQPVYDQPGAESILRDHPETLRTERGYVIRSGDLGKIWLFSLGAFLKGGPQDPDAFEFNRWFFILGLVGVLIAAWSVNRFALGVFLVAFIGSNPFQLYEVYADNVPGPGQVFALVISAALWALAAHIPLIYGRSSSRAYLYSLPIATGIFFGTLRQVRSDPVVLILSVLACYILATGLTWRMKAAMSLLLLVVLVITSQGWNYYWDSKIRQSTAVVAEAGGRPYPGELTRNHILWHPIWCGLGDFGKDHGYAWDDVAAYDYAVPILKREGVIDYDMIGTEKSTAWYDAQQLYYKMVWTNPQYEEVLRDKVLGDIAHDPAWYLGVLFKRAWRILTDVTPARVALGASRIDLPSSGLLLIPTLAGLILLRRWSLLKLLCFTLPLASTAFIIYSGSGFTYYSIYPQIVWAIYLAALWGGIHWVRETVLTRVLASAGAAGREET